MTPRQRIRIEKAALDCGFEITGPADDFGVKLRSAQFPDEVEVQPRGEARFSVATSGKPWLLDASSTTQPLQVEGFDELYDVLAAFASKARALANPLDRQLDELTGNWPRSTEVERLAIQRVGQQLYREALLVFWRGRCCVTGLQVPDLLRASHIKPWAACESDRERLDVCNGLLLAPHLDAMFDGGWVSFTDSGEILISEALTLAARTTLAVSTGMKINGLTPDHGRYLVYHRNSIFRRVDSSS